MRQVEMLDATSQLAKLVAAVESGEEAEIVIARDGKPAARLVPIEPQPRPATRRLGIAAGRYAIPSDEEWEALDDAIAELFSGVEEKH